MSQNKHQLVEIRRTE
jgi:hypothetical protein